MTEEQELEIIASDTCSVIKLQIIDLSNILNGMNLLGTSFKNVGLIKAYKGVSFELKTWIENDKKKIKRGKRHPKARKFEENISESFLQDTLDRSKLHKVEDPTFERRKFELRKKVYRGYFSKVQTNGKLPEDEDLKLLYHCECTGNILLTDDSALYQIGKIIIKNMCISTPELLIMLHDEGHISKEEVKKLVIELERNKEGINIMQIQDALSTAESPLFDL